MYNKKNLVKLPSKSTKISNPDNKLIINNFNIKIYLSDLSTLNNTNMLNDNIINIYLKLLYDSIDNNCFFAALDS